MKRRPSRVELRVRKLGNSLKTHGTGFEKKMTKAADLLNRYRNALRVLAR